MNSYEFFEKFEDYSSFSQVIKKSFLIKIQDSDKIWFASLLRHLLKDDPLDIFMLKMCAFWEVSVKCQEFIICDKELILTTSVNHLNKFSRQDERILDPQSQTASVRMIHNLVKSGIGVSNEEEVVNILKMTMLNCDTLAETALLSGTTMVSLIMKHSLSDEHTVEKLVGVFKDLKMSEFASLCLIHGILSTGGLLILLVQEQNSQELLIWDIFNRISFLCSNSANFDFHSFSLLRLWTSRLKEICQQVCQETENKVQIEVSDEHVQEVIKLCENNYENSLKGVSEICFQTYQDILEVISTAWSITMDYQSFLELSLQQAMSLRWSQKSKYIKLIAILPRIGVKEVLSSYGSLPKDLTISLASVHLIHSGAELYKIILNVLDQSSWEAYFGNVLIDSLLSKDIMIHQSCIQQWLPVTLKLLPSSYIFLANNLIKSDSDQRLVGVISLLSVSKKIGGNDMENVDNGVLMQNTIQEALVHSNSDVRSKAFACLCTNKKKSLPPSKDELKSILIFLTSNTHEDCSKFRQSVGSSFSALCIRCRDYMTQLYRNKLKSIDSENLDLFIDFIDEILIILMKNLLPGGNYQRKIFSLNLLKIFIDNFIQYNSQGSNKASGNGDPQLVIQYSENKGKVKFFSDKNLKILLLNIEDHMTDVMEKSKQILTLFNPSKQVRDQVFRKMLVLINSVKEGKCASGALLASLLSTWWRVKPLTLDDSDEYQSFHDINLKPTMSLRWSHKSDHQNLASHLLKLYRSTLTSCKNRFLLCSRETPMYGIIASIRRCLMDNNSEAMEISLDNEELSQLVNLLEETVIFMLKVLSGNMANDPELVNADFQEMAKAIDCIISSSEDASINLDNENEEISIPVDHQLLLSAAWHNLKEAAILGGNLVHCLPLEPESTSKTVSLTLKNIETIGNMLVKISSRCRHKGAMESASLACGILSTRLVTSHVVELKLIPHKMLEIVFGKLTQSWASSSFTRRGAGLPGLIQRLVGSEPINKPRSLLPFVINRLLNIVEKDINDNKTDNNETDDTAASHAIHILRSLVQDSYISRELGLYMTRIAQTCLNNFNSHSWSVRNASLQLFGGLMPRIVGQKKVRDDQVGFNNVSVCEVSSRFPGLIELLIDRLIEQPLIDKTLLVDPGVVPVLTVLARMESRGLETDLSSRLVEVVTRYSNFPVIQVRSLAARTLSQFVSKTAENLLLEVVNNIQTTPANRRHFDIMMVKELVRKDKYESGSTVCQLLVELDKMSTCFVIKSEILVLQNQLKAESLDCQPHLMPGFIFEPGFHYWRDNLLDGDDNCQVLSDLISRLSQDLPSQSRTERAVDLLKQLCDNFTESTGHMLYKLLDLILSGDPTSLLSTQHGGQIMLAESDMALDILDCLEQEGVVNICNGPDITGKVMLLKAHCLNSMLMQDDWEWFFGDTSEYICHVVENTEDILSVSTPDNTETCRQLAAYSLLAYLPTLQARQVKGNMALILQYSVVNILNAALILFQDEEHEVRSTVIQFGSGLPRLDRFNLPPFPSLSQNIAHRCVVLYGLDQLSQVVEMFTPVVKVLLLPAQMTKLMLEQIQMTSSSLFKRGDGLNVYEEESYTLVIYHSCIVNFLTTSSFQLNINMDTVLEMAEDLINFLQDSKGKLYSQATTKDGFCLVTGFQCLLNLLVNSRVIKSDLTNLQRGELERLRATLNTIVLSRNFIL